MGKYDIGKYKNESFWDLLKFLLLASAQPIAAAILGCCDSDQWSRRIRKWTIE